MKKSVIVLAVMLFTVLIFSQLTTIAYAENLTLPPPPPPPSISSLHSSSSVNLTNATLANQTANATANTTVTNQTQQTSAAGNTIASLNAEILTLRQEIARLNATIASDKTEIARLTQEIANLQVINSAVDSSGAKTSSAVYILTALVVILFLIVMWFAMGKFFKKNTQQPSGIPDHRQEVLKQYIRSNSNVPARSLRQELINHGWPAEEIDGAMKEAGNV